MSSRFPLSSPAFVSLVTKHVEETLRKSEQRFKALSDNINQLAWIADGTGWISWYNSRWFEYTGTTLEEMQGWGWQKVHHPDHLDHVVKRWRRAHETGEPWEDTFPLRGKDGQYRWFLSRAMPIYNAEGRVMWWFGTNTDVTVLREAEEQIRGLLIEAQHREHELRDKQEQLIQAAKMASLGVLASGVAHEINNPLNNINLCIGNAVEALRQKAPRERIGEGLRLAQREVLKAASIINNLRTFARKAVPDRELVAVNEVPQQAVELLYGQIRVASIDFECRYAKENPVVPGSALQLEQVIVNPLTNARDAVESTEKKKLGLWTAQEDGHAVIAVKDTGEGMMPESQARIFEPFFTTKDIGRGTGLGLSISYAIIKGMNGVISVQSEIGSGFTFMIRLPLAEHPNSPGTMANGTGSATACTGS